MCSGRTGAWFAVHIISCERDCLARGCVSPSQLSEMAGYGVDRITGFVNLRSEDQKKIRVALALKRVDPSDLPAAAQVLAVPSSSQTLPPSSQPPASSQPPLSQTVSSTPSVSGPSQKKRKAAFEAAMAASQPTPSQRMVRPAQPVGIRKINVPIGTTWEEGAEDDAPADEPLEELYCTMKSNVVGIQYYKGEYSPFCTYV